MFFFTLSTETVSFLKVFFLLFRWSKHSSFIHPFSTVNGVNCESERVKQKKKTHTKIKSIMGNYQSIMCLLLSICGKKSYLNWFGFHFPYSYFEEGNKIHFELIELVVFNWQRCLLSEFEEEKIREVQTKLLKWNRLHEIKKGKKLEWFYTKEKWVRKSHHMWFTWCSHHHDISMSANNNKT